MLEKCFQFRMVIGVHLGRPVFSKLLYKIVVISILNFATTQINAKTMSEVSNGLSIYHNSTLHKNIKSGNTTTNIDTLIAMRHESNLDKTQGTTRSSPTTKLISSTHSVQGG